MVSNLIVFVGVYFIHTLWVTVDICLCFSVNGILQTHNIHRICSIQSPIVTHLQHSGRDVGRYFSGYQVLPASHSAQDGGFKNNSG